MIFVIIFEVMTIIDYIFSIGKNIITMIAYAININCNMLSLNYYFVFFHSFWAVSSVGRAPDF